MNWWWSGIFWPKPSIAERGSEAADDRREPSSAEPGAPMRAGGDQPLELVLPPGGRVAGERSADAADGRVALELPVVRLPADGPCATAHGPSGGSQAGAAIDAGDGLALPGAAAEHLSPGPGASGVSVPAARSGSGSAQPGVVCRSDVSADGARLFVPGGYHGLVLAQGAVLGALHDAGHGVLRACAAGGDRAQTARRRCSTPTRAASSHPRRGPAS